MEHLSRAFNVVSATAAYSSEFISCKFASTFIRIRAFHKAISRSCILLRFNKLTKMIKNNFVDTICI